MRMAGVTNVRALLGGFEEWLKRGGKIETETPREQRR
jgi:3-mercaptopyruvate sulfurtransferase SseA